MLRLMGKIWRMVINIPSVIILKTRGRVKIENSNVSFGRKNDQFRFLEYFSVISCDQRR